MRFYEKPHHVDKSVKLSIFSSWSIEIPSSDSQACISFDEIWVWIVTDEIWTHFHWWDFMRSLITLINQSNCLSSAFKVISWNLIKSSWMKLFSKENTWLLLCQLWETLTVCQKVKLYQQLNETEKAWVDDTAFEVNVLQSYLLNSFKILDTALKSNMIAKSVDKLQQELHSSESNSSGSNSSELSNSKLNIKENMSHCALNLIKIIKMICKLKLKCNAHHLMYLLWKWNMHLFSSDAPDNACSLYTDVSLTANLNSNDESTWSLSRQIMLDNYWMREIICREIRSEKWGSCWPHNFNKKKVTCMQCQSVKCASKELEEFKEGVKVMYYHMILNRYQLIEDEGMQAEWAYSINKLKNLITKSLTLWEEVTADSEDWLRTVDELMRWYDVEYSDAQSDEKENVKDQSNKKKKEENADKAGQTESELIRSEENDEDIINNEYRNKWRWANSSSDDLESLSLPAQKNVNTDVKDKYDTVIHLAHKLDHTLFKQLIFKKELFAELSEISATLKLIKQLKTWWNTAKMKWDMLWKLINERKFDSLKVIFCHSDKGNDEMSWLYQSILILKDTAF